MTRTTQLVCLTPLLAACACNPASAQADAARRGDHPAVVVQRLWARQGYDYAARFYPHPAWLYLSAEAPRPMTDHPAVIVFRREQPQDRPVTAVAADGALR